MIFVVTTKLAFSQPLKTTTREVEFSIVMAAKKWLVPKSEEAQAPDREMQGVRAVSMALQAGFQRIARHFAEENKRSHVTQLVDSDAEDVIFRVTAARVFSQPLKDTIRDVERAIILVACIRYRCNKDAVCKALKAGKGRVDRHFSDIRQELQFSGFPLHTGE
jgi:hypothetical protein